MFLSISAYGQSIQDPNQAINTATPTTSISSLVLKGNKLNELKNKFDENLKKWKETEAFNKKIASAAAIVFELEKKLESQAKEAFFSFQKIANLREEVRKSIDQIEGQLAEFTQTINFIEKEKRDWTENQKIWEDLETKYKDESKNTRELIDEALKKIKVVLKGFSGLETPWLELQKKAIEELTRLKKVHKKTEEIIKELRKGLFRKTQPTVFNSIFWKQLGNSISKEELAKIPFKKITGPILSFYENHLFWGLIVSFILWLTIIYKIKNNPALKENWAMILDSPILLCLFASFLGILLIIKDANTGEYFLTIIGLALTYNIWLARNHKKVRFLKGFILLGIAILILEVFKIIEFSLELYRLNILIISFLGFIFLRYEKSKFSDKYKISEIYFLTIASSACFFVFICDMLGFTNLSQYLLNGIIRTILALIVAHVLISLFKGFSNMFVMAEIFDKGPIIKKNRQLLCQRMGLIFQGAVLFWLLAMLSAIWKFSDSTFIALKFIFELGFVIDGMKISIGRLIGAIGLFWCVSMTSWVIQIFLREEIYPRQKIAIGVGISINRLIHYAFLVLGIVIALSSIGFNFQNFAFIVGALGIGIGFGLQNIVNNFASGLILLFERSIKVGDMVQINNDWGTVKNLGLRATIVETFDKSEMIVPNSELVANKVINWTLSDRKTRLIIPVGIAYGSDVKTAFNSLKEVAQTHGLVSKNPEPMVLFMSFGDNSLNFELRVWVEDVDNRLAVKSDLHKMIDERFRNRGIEISFPQRDLHLRTVDPDIVKDLLRIKAEPNQEEEKENE